MKKYEPWLPDKIGRFTKDCAKMTTWQLMDKYDISAPRHVDRVKVAFGTRGYRIPKGRMPISLPAYTRRKIWGSHLAGVSDRELRRTYTLSEFQLADLKWRYFHGFVKETLPKPGITYRRWLDWCTKRLGEVTKEQQVVMVRAWQARGRAVGVGRPLGEQDWYPTFSKEAIGKDECWGSKQFWLVLPSGEMKATVGSRVERHIGERS